MKKAYVNIIVLVLVLIPSLIAAVVYLSTNATPVKQETIERLDIITPIGETFTINNDADTEGFYELAMKMNDTAQKQQWGLPQQLQNAAKQNYYTFKYYTLGNTLEYKYYFSTNPESAYYENDNMVAYKISEELAEQFLNTKYANCLFDYNKPPVATINSQIVQITTADWKFKNHHGEFITSNVISGINNVIDTYGTPAISFDIEPDTLDVIVKNGDTIVYTGPYESLANKTFDPFLADVQIIAKWFDDASRVYKGTLTYDLRFNFKEPPVFYISSNTAEIGNVITLSVSGVEDPSLINITCEPELNLDFNFYKGEKYTTALIPISLDVIPSSYKLTADYNGQSKTTFTIDVTSEYVNPWTYNVDASLFGSIYNEENINEYKAFINSVFKSTQESALFEGSFNYGLHGYESAVYNMLLTITNNEVSFVNPGMYYTCNQVTEVKAVNSGKVIAVGKTALTGNIVAVDHGMGVTSLYMHLGDVSVNNGDTVTKDTVLGVSGRSGLMSKKDAASSVVRVELYVNALPVNIEYLVENGIVFTN